MENKFRKDIEIRWTDIDEYGMVNNVHFLNYFQEARHWYLTQIDWDWSKSSLVVLKHEIFFKMPVSRYDRIFVITHITEIGKSSLKLEYSIYNHTNTIVCHGSSIIVGYDKELNASQPIDNVFIKSIEEFEGKKLTKE